MYLPWRDAEARFRRVAAGLALRAGMPVALRAEHGPWLVPSGFAVRTYVTVHIDPTISTAALIAYMQAAGVAQIWDDHVAWSCPSASGNPIYDVRVAQAACAEELANMRNWEAHELRRQGVRAWPKAAREAARLSMWAQKLRYRLKDPDPIS